MARDKQKQNQKQKEGAKEREYKNRRVFFEFQILEKVEAGIVLMGSEVKAIREGKLILSDSYARVENGQVYLVNCHIAEYKNAGAFGHEPLRKRKLLLHRAEIRKLEKRVELKGLTIVPLRVFFSARGMIKVELGIAKGKQAFDKRQTVKEREGEREIRREISKYGQS